MVASFSTGQAWGQSGRIRRTGDAVPMVCLPNLAADQPALAHRVAELGAGIVLDGAPATPSDIAGAVRTVLGDTAYRDNARRLAEVIKAAPGAEGIASRLTGLLAAR
ncbi:MULTISPECIES: glycosyltransferase [unclassified Spirillospora]|uniref:glycosyltransferase n=1 Tax=unclassified Spirillospora TaxID=2642701 RepID=UPI00370FDE10